MRKVPTTETATAFAILVYTDTSFDIDMLCKISFGYRAQGPVVAKLVFSKHTNVFHKRVGCTRESDVQGSRMYKGVGCTSESDVQASRTPHQLQTAILTFCTIAARRAFKNL
jgi:hypothetical protein